MGERKFYQVQDCGSDNRVECCCAGDIEEAVDGAEAE